MKNQLFEDMVKKKKKKKKIRCQGSRLNSGQVNTNLTLSSLSA